VHEYDLAMAIMTAVSQKATRRLERSALVAKGSTRALDLIAVQDGSTLTSMNAVMKEADEQLHHFCDGFAR
jgi:hypothetical protein